MTEAKNSRNQKLLGLSAVFITASLGVFLLAFNNGLLLAYFSRLEISSSEIFCCWRCLRFCSSCWYWFQLSFGPGWQELIGATGYSAQQAHFIFFGSRFQRRVWRHSFSVAGVFFSGSGRPCRSATGCPAPSFNPQQIREGFSAGSD